MDPTPHAVHGMHNCCEKGQRDDEPEFDAILFECSDEVKKNQPVSQSSEGKPHTKVNEQKTKDTKQIGKKNPNGRKEKADK